MLLLKNNKYLFYNNDILRLKIGIILDKYDCRQYLVKSFLQFQIRCHADQDGSPVLELISMATCMPQYSIADLHEVLENITRCSSITLGDSRPLKVKYYLQVRRNSFMAWTSLWKQLQDQSLIFYTVICYL